MFKFLKEALNELNTPVNPASSTQSGQRNASPLRQSFSLEPGGRPDRRSSSFTSVNGRVSNAGFGPGQGQGNGRQSVGSASASALGATSMVREKSKRQMNREEIEGMNPTEEDKLVEGMVKELKRILRSGGKDGLFADDVEEVIIIMDKLHSQLARHVPAAQTIFRLSSGFPVIRRLLRRLGTTGPSSDGKNVEPGGVMGKMDSDTDESESEEVEEEEGGPKGLRARTRMTLPHSSSALGYSALTTNTSSEQGEQGGSKGRGRSDSLVIIESGEGEGGITRLVFPEEDIPALAEEVLPDTSVEIKQLKEDETKPNESATAATAQRPMDPSRKFLAIKLCFYVLDDAIANETNRRYFADDEGWTGFEKVIRAVSELVNGRDTSSTTDEGDGTGEHLDLEVERDIPNTVVLGILFSTAFGADESLLGVFDRYLPRSSQDGQQDKEMLPTWPLPLPISPSLNLTHPTLLPIIFSILPLPYWVECRKDPSSEVHGKRKEKPTSFMTPSQIVLEHLVWRIILVAVQSSWINLFHIQTHMPTMIEGILDRLYPPPEVEQPSWSLPRKGKTDQRSSFDDTAWSSMQQNLAPPEEDVGSSSSGSRYPSSVKLEDNEMNGGNDVPTDFDFREKAEQPLRAILLRVLKRSVEAGIPPQYSHKLFRLARSGPAVRPTNQPRLSTGAGQVSKGKPGAQRKRPVRAPSLHLDIDSSPPLSQTKPVQQLDGDILDVIRHGMSKRWPDMFCFSPQTGGSAGGIFMSELGRPWPAAQKGYHFMTWVYVEQLSQPITLLHLYDSKRTVLRIRLLPNSQIGVLSTASAETPIKEHIFSDEDALVPHRRWVHLGIGCRKRKSQDASGDLKLMINGKRAGAVRCTYPQPTEKIEPRVIVGKDGRHVEEQDGIDYRNIERSTFFMATCMLLGEYLPDDLGLLVHHLGPRYQSNLQEPLGRFLTYEAATALNIYLSTMATVPKDQSKPVLPGNSYLIKGIREGQLVSEDTILFSLSASNFYRARRRSQRPGLNAPLTQRKVYNAALPMPIKANETANASAALDGDVFTYRPVCLDEAISIVGGPIVALRIVELSATSKELLETVSILWEAVRESWSASEDMERMRGFDLLAGILKAKMSKIVDVPVARAVFGTLGIEFDKPERATIHNSAAYKTLTRFDLWSDSSGDVFSLYLEQYRLLFRSRHKRFNVMRYFKKAGLTRRMLFALRAELMHPEAVADAIDTLQLALSETWSMDEAIKPVFAYLVASLCNGSRSNAQPYVTTAQGIAGAVFAQIPKVVEDPSRLAKLIGSLPVHRVIIVFLSCEPSLVVVESCLQLARLCIAAPTGQFAKRFESEGGFALLAQVLPEQWNDTIGSIVLPLLIGPDADASVLAVPPLLSCVFATFERLLQEAIDGVEVVKTPQFGLSRSEKASTQFSASLGAALPSQAGDDSLGAFVQNLSETYYQSLAFQHCFNAHRLERLIPGIADFLSVSAHAETASEGTIAARRNLLQLLELWLAKGDQPELMRSQLAALSEQIRATELLPRATSVSLSASPSSLSLASSTFATSSPPRLSMLGSALAGRQHRRTRTGDRQSFDRRATIKAKAILERRMPLRRQFTGEGALAEKKDKLMSWKDSIITAEAARFLKTSVELREFWNRISKRDWPRQFSVVDSDASLWPAATENPHWRLDGTEGSMRKRLKLERALINPADKSSAFHPKTHRNAIPRNDELGSAVSRFASPADEDPFALAMGEATNSRPTPLAQIEEGDDKSAGLPIRTADLTPGRPLDKEEQGVLEQMAADDTDKYRRVVQTLQSGDAVEEAFNISRVVGVDSAPGLLIIGKKNLYLIDGLAQTKSGEIISSQDASRDLFTIPSGTMAELDASELQSHRWAYGDIVENSKRSFLFRDVAVEFFFADKRNFLCVFSTKKDRQIVLQRIASKLDPNAIKRSALGTFVSETVAKAIDKAAVELEGMTARWQRREISNFAYLQAVNQMANRTPNDVTQYPVFPWVLQDYKSNNLDLQTPSTFRDLALPMGALTAERRAAASERYQQTQLAGEKPFQFGTHFSSSMIVCSFNIRVSPYTEMFLALQGGAFDLADRLFSSVPQAWDSASKDSRGDVRELIPEFYYSPLFLRNSNRHDFGRKQVTGEIVDEVKLPPWALGDALLFIHRHREALESDWVSKNLPAWIDLTFGYKQHDPAAFTCFHPLSYKDAIDLDAIVDEAEKAASVGIIHNFGQTPHKIFKDPHPQRYVFGRTTLPIDQKFGIDEHWLLLIRGAKPVLESSMPLVGIFTPTSSDLPPQALPYGRIPFAQLVTSTLRFGFHDQSLRGYHGASKLVWLSESTPVDIAAFVSSGVLATASPSGIVTIWKVQQSGAPYLNEGSSLIVETALRGHSQKVLSLVPNGPWSILISCSQDGTAIVWDMNRMRFLRRITVWPLEPVLFADVHHSEGHIVLVTPSRIHAFTLNGEHIASMEASAGSLETYSMSGAAKLAAATKFCGGVSFFEKDFSREGPLLSVGQGEDIVLLRLTPGTASEQPWVFRELRRLRGPDRSGDVTAIKFFGDALYACLKGGDGATMRGTLYQWSLPEGGARLLAENSVQQCMSCSKTFGILEPRRNCGGCGGVFCSSDAVQPAAVLSTLTAETHNTVLLHWRVETWRDVFHPTRLQLALSQPLRVAASLVSRRLVVVLENSLFERQTPDWETIQTFVGSIYTAAAQVLRAQGKGLLDIDVIIEGFCTGRNQLQGAVDHVVVARRGEEHNPYLRSLLGSDAGMAVTVAMVSKQMALEDPESPMPFPQSHMDASPALNKRHPVVALGGTFDHLHAGHKILLTMAAYVTCRKLIVGLSDDALLRNKAYAEQLETISVRTSRVKAFLDLIDPDNEHMLVPLHDVYGPTAVDADIQALVLSRESVEGGKQIAALRIEKQLPALVEYVIDVISTSSVDLTGELDPLRLKELKMGSTFIRQELARQASSNRGNIGTINKGLKEGPSMKDFGFNMRYCPTCRTTVASGMSVIGHSRRSSVASVRAGSVSSRRGSIM